MNEYYLRKLLSSREEQDKKISEYIKQGIIREEEPNKNEIEGHMQKAEHNIKFVDKISNLGYSDWIIVGCYYCLYHAALSLILKKGFSSKNHDATLCLLIKYYYKEITEEEIELINFTFLNNEDILFYVESRDKRRDASYSTKTAFDKSDVSKIILKTRLLFNKSKSILENE